MLQNHISPEHGDAAVNLFDYFTRVVARFPEKAAVKAGEKVYTYQQLDGAAHRIGRYLLRQLGKEPRVGRRRPFTQVGLVIQSHRDDFRRFDRCKQADARNGDRLACRN